MPASARSSSPSLLLRSRLPALRDRRLLRLKALAPRHNRLPWAELLRRTFQVDVLTCSKCGGRRQVIAYITEPPVVRAILNHLGLPSRASTYPLAHPSMTVLARSAQGRMLGACCDMPVYPP